MDRRDFIGFLGCGCLATATGCGGRLLRRQEDGAHSDEPSLLSGQPSEWDISVCGLNCARCRLRESGDCGGCRGSLDDHWSPGCQFLPCAREKGHTYCFECDQFPCDKLKAFAADGYEHHRLAVENLKSMKELGLETWIAHQPAVMFCPGWLF